VLRISERGLAGVVSVTNHILSRMYGDEKDMEGGRGGEGVGVDGGRSKGSLMNLFNLDRLNASCCQFQPRRERRVEKEAQET